MLSFNIEQLTFIFDNHFLSAVFGFISSHYIFLTSIVIGMLFFLFFFVVGSPLLTKRYRKQHFLRHHNNTTPFQAKKLFINSFWRKNSFLANFYETYQWSSFSLSYESFLLLMIFLAVFVFIVLSMTGSILLGFLGIVLVFYFSFLLVRLISKHSQQKMSQQLPFVLETLSGSIQSGYSLSQAIKFTSQEINGPLALVFKKIIYQINYNIPLATALTNTQKSISNPEIKMVFDGLIIQDKMGGDIVQMLKQMANWIRQKNKLRKDIKVFTSQGRLSGLIIVLLWPLSAIVFYLLNADYISILFTTSLGKMFLAISLLLEIIGFLMIWRIIKIRI